MLIPGLNPAEARWVLFRRKQIHIQEIASENGIHKSTASKVLAGKTRSKRLEAVMAAKVGLSVEEFFPEHYPS